MRRVEREPQYLEILDGLLRAEVGEVRRRTQLGYAVRAEARRRIVRRCLGAVVGGNRDRAREPTREPDASLVEEDDVEPSRDRRVEVRRVGVGEPDAGAARAAGRGHEEPLALAGRRQDREDDVDRPPVGGVEVVERHGERDAAELAFRARRRAEPGERVLGSGPGGPGGEQGHAEEPEEEGGASRVSHQWKPPSVAATSPGSVSTLYPPSRTRATRSHSPRALRASSR